MRKHQRAIRFWSLAIVLMLVLPALAVGRASAQDKVTLTVLTHWTEQHVAESIQPIFDEYEASHPNVTIEHQTVTFNDLLTRITSGRLGGDAPDIYHFYNLWLPDFAGSELLGTPPAEVVSDVQAGYTEGTVGGASYADQVWGYPTEVNDYQLIYNKQFFVDAGLDPNKPPTTWEELRETAKAITKKDADGKITAPGFLFLTGWDSGVVHPFTSLLWSNGGQYVADDYSEVLFNQQPGLDVLQLQMDMIADGSVDLAFKQADFEAGNAGMTIMANWWGATLRTSIPGGIENIGVASIPAPAGKQSATIQYEWLWGVDKNSEHAEESWAFLQWLNNPRQAGASSPMGDFLTSGLNAIPSRTSDQEAHADLLSDPFVKPFVDALQVSRTEPIIPGAQEIKTALQKQIEAAWFGEKEPVDALNAAAEEANRILEEKAG